MSISKVTMFAVGNTKQPIGEQPTQQGVKQRVQRLVDTYRKAVEERQAA